MIMYTDTPDAQRALLLRLDDLTSEHERALDAGDMAFLTELSELRTNVHQPATNTADDTTMYHHRCQALG